MKKQPTKAYTNPDGTVLVQYASAEDARLAAGAAGLMKAVGILLFLFEERLKIPRKGRAPILHPALVAVRELVAEAVGAEYQCTEQSSDALTEGWVIVRNAPELFDSLCELLALCATDRDKAKHPAVLRGLQVCDKVFEGRS